MRNHLALVLAAVGALAAAPSVAGAAAVSVDRTCYSDASQRQDLVSFSGEGFAAGKPFTVTLDGKPLAGGAGTVDSAGDIDGSFIAPKLKTISKTTYEHVYTLALSDGTTSSTTTFTVAKLFADFKPSKGNPKTLKVVFNLFGFGLQGDVNPTIYVHYVAPNGKVKKTRSLGHGRGACGSRKKTAKQSLFGFNAVHGSWKLQFDTSKKYKRGKAGADFLFYVVPVSVKRG